MRSRSRWSWSSSWGSSAARSCRPPSRPLGVASAIGSGALYYAGAYWFYLGALRHVPASFAAVSFYLIPIIGVTASALLLGERLEPQQWVGALIVIGAVLAIARQQVSTTTEVPAQAVA